MDASSGSKGSERITSMGDMNDATYEFYVAPLLRRIEQLEGEKKERERLIALIIEKFGGSVEFDPMDLLAIDDLELVRMDNSYDLNIRFLARRRVKQ